jgi:hypothetical protein
MALALVRLIAQPTPERTDAVRQAARSVDVEGMLDLLAPQRLVPTLGGPLLEAAQPELPAHVVERIQAARLRARTRGLLHHDLTRRLTVALSERGIPVAPLKGAELAEAVYGDIGARQSSDIDLLVPLAELDRAVEVAESHGWREPELLRAAGRPRLHRELFHATLPPLELHWRVHWYEDSFAGAALARARASDEGWLRLQPADEVAFLLLFLARDGFAGLRQTVDVAAWWAALGEGETTPARVRAVANAHPRLKRALMAAASHVENVAALPPGSLARRPGGLSRRQHAALRLANPWLSGSREQIRADVSLVDGLLGPRHGVRGFIGRQVLPPRWVLLRRQPKLQRASRARVGAARVGHAARVLGRYALASRALITGPRSSRRVP